jgi:uncharacterized protein YbjT (DUF2867 family)
MKIHICLFVLLAALVATACDRSPAPEESVAKAQSDQSISSEAENAVTNEPTEPGLILVSGATGTQGGAVARELLNRGYRVRALTRDPASSKAQALASLGAEVVQGDFNDPDSIAQAIQGVDGVFAVTLFWSYGYEVEVEQGKRLIDKAAEAKVDHFVLTSVASADAGTGIPHFESKWEVEQYLHESDLTWTVIRPVEFMDNWNWSVEQFKAGTWVDPRAPESTHQWIAASDIGFFAAEAFDQKDEWAGMTLEIAGDDLTLSEFTALLSAAFGHDVVQQRVGWDVYEAQAGEEITMMIRWFEEEGYSVDIAALRERYPGLTTAEEFVQELAGKSGEDSQTQN